MTPLLATDPTYEVKCRRSLTGWRYYVAMIDHDIDDYPKMYRTLEEAQEIADHYNMLKEA